MDSVTRQQILLDLLNHFSNGNFASFDRLACKAWQIESRDRQSQNLVHNQLQACHMGGLVDAFETDTSLRWSANFDDSGIVFSNRPKKTWRGSVVDNDLRPLVVDEYKNVLLLGSILDQKLPRGNSFPFTPNEFFQALPSLVSLSEEFVRKEKWRGDEQREVEVFDSKNFNWFSRSFNSVTESSLIRIRGDFSGRSYFLVIPDTRILFRITNPEWSHLLAGAFLGWNFKSIFRSDGTALHIEARFKLPGLIKRYLFANAAWVQCGASTVFKDFCPTSYAALLTFLGGLEPQ